ncbi:MAG: hypothetical protein P9M15_03330 [Candidatus Electryoneaceae bacterium]|nr:hypothetical protein [Candidatus Electryoneaceae bacterium]
MNNAKVEFSIGQISFSSEGDEKWVADQLDKFLEKVPDLVKISESIKIPVSTQQGEPEAPVEDEDKTIAQKPLGKFLPETGSTEPQHRKFLATAVWLHSKGKGRLSTGDIIKALKDASQSKLSNASDSLKANFKKGLCEKDGTEFFVTDEGKRSITGSV